MGKQKQVFLGIVTGIIVVVALAKCSYSSNHEEDLQIESAPTLANTPTYCVEKIVANEAELIQIEVRRPTDTKTGSEEVIGFGRDSTFIVNFYPEETPSAEYLKSGDSIKISFETSAIESRIDGRYQTRFEHNATVFIFVDQLPLLLQKYKEFCEK